MREFEIAHLAWPLIERDPLHARLFVIPADQHRGLEFGMEAFEIARIAEPRVGKTRIEIRMAIRTELLRRGRNFLRTFMFGMTIDAAPVGLPEALLDRDLEPAPPAQIRRRSSQSA